MSIRLLFVAAAAFAALFVLCSRELPVSQDDTEIIYPGPGAFSISRVQNLAKIRSDLASRADGRVGFDLGSVKGSATYYFLLYNVGFSPITDISIAFADSHFAAFPGRMDTLFPGIDIGLLPIVKVDAVHGTALNGVGYRPLLPMGDDTAVLTITGTTRKQDGKDSTLVLSARMSVRALVMDVEVRDTGAPLSLAAPGGRVRGNFPEGVAEMPFYPVSGCTVAVKNTGNVPITLKTWSQQVNSQDTSFGNTVSQTVAPGSVTRIPRTGMRQVMCIDGNNAVSDQVKLPLLPNGKCYFLLRGDTPCQAVQDTTVQINSFYTLYYMVSTTCPSAKCRFFLIDSAMVFWELAGKETCKYVTAGNRIYRLYGKTPDKLLASCQGEDYSYWTIEHYESKAYHSMLDTIRANLSADDLGLGKSHSVVLIVQQ